MSEITALQEPIEHTSNFTRCVLAPPTAVFITVGIAAIFASGIAFYKEALLWKLVGGNNFETQATSYGTNWLNKGTQIIGNVAESIGVSKKIINFGTETSESAQTFMIDELTQEQKFVHYLCEYKQYVLLFSLSNIFIGYKLFSTITK